MGLRGPAPKPTTLKILEGTYRADRAATAEPTPDVAVLVPPPWLVGDALEEWNRSAPVLEQLGVSASIDYAVFLGYCLSYARALQAEEDIAINGLTVVVWGQAQKNPAVTIAQQEWAQVAKLAAQFGLTPSSRSRVSGTPKKPADAGGKNASTKRFRFGRSSSA